MIKSLAKKISCATLVLFVLGTFFIVNVSAEEDSPHIDGFNYFDYYQLEYIDSPFLAYINTGVPTNLVTEFSISFDILQSNYARLFGALENDNARMFFTIPNSPDNCSIAFNNYREVYSLSSYLNHFVSYSNNVFRFDDNSFEFDSSTSTSLEFYMFSCNVNGSSANAQAKRIYSYSLNNKLFIPAQNIKTLEVGFYCVNDGSFVQSSSSVKFVAGPIISPNVSYGININCIQSNHYVGSFDIPANTIKYNCYTDYRQYFKDAYLTNSQPTYIRPPEAYESFKGYRIDYNGLMLDLKGSINGYSTDVGTIDIPKMTINTGNDIDVIYEFEVVFDRSYLGSYKVSYYDGSSVLDRTVYVNGVKSTFNIVGNYSQVALSNFNFVPNDPNTTMNVGSYESNSAAQSTNESFINTSSSFDSLEAGQLEQTQSSLSNINTNFSFGGNSKFLKSAQFVKTQFDYHFSNNEFGSLLIFSLTVGLVMLLIGKVMK